MAYTAGSGAASAAAVAAIANAIKASGAIVRVEPDDFNRILSNVAKPLVVIAKGGFFKPNFPRISWINLLLLCRDTTEHNECYCREKNVGRPHPHPRRYDSPYGESHPA